jgi:hypothetical protein
VHARVGHAQQVQEQPRITHVLTATAVATTQKSMRRHARVRHAQGVQKQPRITHILAATAVATTQKSMRRHARVRHAQRVQEQLRITDVLTAATRSDNTDGRTENMLCRMMSSVTGTQARRSQPSCSHIYYKPARTARV